MYLKVYAKGYGGAKGTHVSVFMYMMRGEFDNELKWPFSGSVTVQLLNHRKNGYHKQYDFLFTDAVSANRVLEKDRAETGMVIEKFISHVNEKLWSHHLKHNCLKFSLKYNKPWR